MWRVFGRYAPRMTVCRACGTEAAAEAAFCSRCGSRIDAGPSIPSDLRAQVFTDLRAEHRLVTVVFADMTGSVRRTRDLNAEEATTLVNPLLQTMVELMVQHGGRIDRFLGDGVLAVFGVPSTHEDDPIRAVKASIGLRERAAELGLEVTVGVNTGRVYFGPVGSSLHEELTVMGPVVNLAARLQGAADTGEVMVGPSTREHIHAAFDLTPRTVTIKGMDHPVTGHLVERPADDPDKVRGIEGLTSHLVGRDRELSRLVSALDDTTTVAIVGDAGLGKSRLSREFRLACDRMWIEGRCQALTAETPFSGFVDLVDRRMPGDAEGVVEALSQLPGLSDVDRDEIAPFLAHMAGREFGDERDLLVFEAEATIRRRLTIDAIVRWMAALSASAPIVVFIDDLHWADPLTVETLVRVQGSSPGVFTLVASRPDPDHPLAQLRGDASGVVELHLDALSDDQTTEMVRRLLTVSGLPALTESTLVDWARGNPFYVEELIRSMIQRGMIIFDEGRWQAGPEPVRLELPESIDALVMSRFDRHGAEARRAGQVAAVLDRSFTDRLFLEVAGEAMAASLDTLTNSGFLDRVDGTRAFTHDLVREAVYSSLLPSQKLELHHLVAETIGRVEPGDHESLAFHYERSADDRAAVEHLHQAAVKALEAYANETAASYVDRGLERIGRLAVDERDRWTAAFMMVRAAIRERATEYEAALSDLGTAGELVASGEVEAAEILIATGRVQHLRGRFEEAFAAFDAGESILDPELEPGAWIALQADRAKAMYFGGRGRELPDLIERVEPVVDRYGSVAQRADLRGLAAFHGFVADRFRMSDDTVENCREALRLAEMGADPARIAEARFRLGFCLLWADQGSEVVSFLERALVDAGRIGDVMLELRAASYLAIALRRFGLPADALRAAESAFDIAQRAADPYYMAHSESVLGWALWRSGDAEAGARHCHASLERWGKHERDGIEGADTEFAWLAVWPLCALATERSEYVEAARHLSLIEVPWERPMGEALAGAVARARREPSAETLDHALRLAADERLL